MCAFFHRDGAGNWHPFSDAENALLERAHADGAPRCRLPTMGANPAGHRDFEVRFGANATSARMPAAPDTGMIQVNVENGNTRIVRRDAPAAPDPFGAAIQLTQDFASSSAMYGWMLRKKLSGWRRGAWQRRFYVLAPRSGALLYFTKGLHTREVQLCRSADPAAPQAKGTILLRNAMILPETVDDDRPHSFSIVVPGAEYHVSAHSAQLKEDWIKQLIKVARGEPLDPPAGAPAPRRRQRRPPPRRRRPPRAPGDLARRRRRHELLERGRPPRRRDAAPRHALGRRPAPPCRPPRRRRGVGRGVRGLRRHAAGRAAVLRRRAAAARRRRAGPFASLPVPTLDPAPPPPAPAYAPPPNPYAAPPDADAPPPDAPPPDAPPPDAPPQLPSPLPSKPSTEDIAESFGAVLQVSGGDAAGSAAEEHSECPVCFDELHSRPCGVLLGDGGRRLCTHIVHLDCLKDLPSGRGTGKPLCPLCRRESGAIVPLPSLFAEPRRWFDLLDVEGDGRVEPDDVLATLKSQLPLDESALDDKWDEIWDHFDMDGTGTLSYDEFVDEERGLRAFLAKFDIGDRMAAAPARRGRRRRTSRRTRRTAPPAAPAPADAPANFDLTVRTNGGRAYSSRDLPPGTVTPDTTVGLLKDIVAQVHGETSVAHVKLINRGIALRDDAASLRDAGVREGDTLMLAPSYQQPQQPSYGQSSYGQSSYGQSSYGQSSYGQPPPSPYGQQAPSYQQPQQPSYGQSSYGQPSYGQPPPSPYGQQAPSYQQPSSYGAYGQQSSPYGAAPPPAFAPAPAPPPAPSPQGRCRVTVPANAGPGSVMTVRAPTGQTVRITVPAGHYAGSSFEFAYDAAARRRRRQRRLRRPAGSAAAHGRARSCASSSPRTPARARR
ncbi:hypothetical protein JL720_11055 [Aureococcus anophagefferens]|nr:hypothetical protein JL720_11055 [Aureococcus anophagefferens]